MTGNFCRLAGFISSSSMAWYWLPLGIAGMFFVALSLLPLWRTQERRNGGSYPGLYMLCLSLVVFLFRWPFLAFQELNPDESQIIASALALVKDPWYWRSVDGGSHGPLIEYPLLLVSLFGGRIDYGSARLIGLGMVIGSLLLCYGSLRKIWGEAVARISLLPFVLFWGSVTTADFIAYNAEHTAFLLLMLATFLLARLLKEPGAATTGTCFALGCCIGAVPFAKLQGIPIAAVAGLAALCVVSIRAVGRRRIIKLCSFLGLGMVAPAVVALSVIAEIGCLEDFYLRYILANMRYAARISMSLRSKLASLPPVLGFDLGTREFLDVMFILAALVLVVVVAAAMVEVLHWLRTRGRAASGCGDQCIASEQSRSTPWLFVALSLLLLGTAIYAVVQPGNFFPHYYLLLLPPLSLFIASGLGIAVRIVPGRAKLAIFLAYLAIAVACQAHNRLNIFKSDDILKTALSCPGEGKSDLATEVLKLARPEDQVVVWGWSNNFHVQTGLVAGTRTTPMHIFGPPELVDYYVESFIAEMNRTKPRLFVDAVAPGMFLLNDKKRFGFELFAPIAAYVTENYNLVKELGEVRIYARKS